MTTTDTATATAQTNINAALADLQTQLPRITKDLTARVQPKDKPGYRYNYADLALISRELLPLMGKLGLSFTSRPTMVDGANFALVYELRHVSGEVIEGVYPLPAPGRGTPQEIGGAITYARRYCLCAVTGVAPDDDDNDAQAAEKAAQRERRREERGGSQAVDDEPRITAQQQRDMQGLFQELGINDKAGRLKFAAGAAKRDLRSATELKQAEADTVIQTLKKAVEKKSSAGVAEAAPDPEKDPEAWVESQEPPADHQGVPAR